MTTPATTPSVIYYDLTSTLEKRDGAQPGTVFIRGLYRTDTEDGIEQSATFDSTVYQHASRSREELQRALGGEREFRHENGTGPVKKYFKIGEIPLDDKAPENIKQLTRERADELIRMSRGGRGEKEDANWSIQFLLDTAARMVSQKG